MIKYFNKQQPMRPYKPIHQTHIPNLIHFAHTSASIQRTHLTHIPNPIHLPIYSFPITTNNIFHTAFTPVSFGVKSFGYGSIHINTLSPLIVDHSIIKHTTTQFFV